MSILTTTRRGFLKGACILSGAVLLGVRMTNKAYAAAKGLKDTMNERIAGVYKVDAAFKKRASQDNAQVKALYDNWLGKPLSELSEKHLHTHWFDKSAGVEALRKAGVYPPKDMEKFLKEPYTYEEA